MLISVPGPAPAAEMVPVPVPEGIDGVESINSNLDQWARSLDMLVIYRDEKDPLAPELLRLLDVEDLTETGLVFMTYDRIVKL